MNCNKHISKFPRIGWSGRRWIVINIFLDFLEEDGVEGDELINIFLDFLEEDGVDRDELTNIFLDFLEWDGLEGD